MQIVIDIPEDTKNRLCFGITYQKDIQTICEALNDGTPIPDNATKGAVIKAMFSHYDIEIDEHKGYVRVFYEDFYTTYPMRWWNAPYQKGGK